MMTDSEARAVLLEAFAARGIVSPTLAELQGVGAIGRFEGRYGSGFGPGVNNWGAIQCQQRPPCDPAKCIEHIDTHADGSKYGACFRRYPTPAAGAADLIRELYRRPGVPEAMRAGDASAVAHAMRATGYFEAPESNYALGIEKNAESIAASLGEPAVMRRGGGAVVVPSDDGPGLGAVFTMLGLAIALAKARGGRR